MNTSNYHTTPPFQPHRPLPKDVSYGDIARKIPRMKFSKGAILPYPRMGSAGRLKKYFKRYHYQLLDSLNEWAHAIAYDENVDDYPCDTTELPTWGPDLTDTVGIYSWDAKRVLVPGPQITVEQTGWELQPRETA